MPLVPRRPPDAVARAVAVAGCAAALLLALTYAAVAVYRRTLVDDAVARAGDVGRFGAADRLADVVGVLLLLCGAATLVVLAVLARSVAHRLPPREPDKPPRALPAPRLVIAGGAPVVWLVLTLLFRAQVGTGGPDGVKRVYGFDVLVGVLVAVVAGVTGWLLLRPRRPPGQAASASR
jgi:hypothetical protein